MSGVDVRAGVLGRPAIAGPDGPRALAGERESKLLALLAARPGQAVTAEELEDQLWGGRLVSDAALRVAVGRLRRRWADIAGEDPIRSEGRAYLLDLLPSEVDAGRFSALVEQARIDRRRQRAVAALATLDLAEALWRGPAFAGCEDLDALRPDRERLEQLRLVAREERAIALLGCERIDDAIGVAERLIVDDPYREVAWAIRIVALARSGRRGRALEAFDEVTRRFADDLGIAPGSDLRRVAEAVRLDDVDGLLEWAGQVDAEAVTAPRTVLVGRDDELATAAEVVQQAQRSGLRLLVVRGEAGIGKTALLEALLDADDQAGGRFVAGRCDRQGVVPLQPALQALRQVIGPGGGAAGVELARLVAGEADDQLPRTDDAVVARHRMLDLIGQVVAETSRRGASVLVFDDMQWADPLTLALVDHIAREVRAAPVVLALGVRSDPRGRTPLDGWLADVGIDVPLTELDLGPIGRDDVARLVGDGVDASQVHEASGGNPLYALQLGRFLEERADGDASLPEGLRRVCRARIDQLDPRVVEVLEAMSVLGPSAWLGDVARLLGTTREQVASAVAGGRQAGVLAWSDGLEEIRVVHGVIRTETYEGLDPGRRAALHHAAAALPGTPRVAVALHLAASWPLATSDDELALAAVRAGFAALAVGAVDAATTFFRILLDLGTTTASDRVAALLGLGAQLLEGADVRAGRALIVEGRAEAKAVGRCDLVADSLSSADVSLVTVSAPEVAAIVEEIDEVLAHLDPSDHGRRARLLGWRADTQINADPARSLADVDHARAEAVVADDDAALALVAYVEVRHASARSDPAGSLLARIDDVLRARPHDPSHAGRVGFVRTTTLLRLGRLDEAQKSLAALRETCRGDAALSMVLALQDLGVMSADRAVPEVDAANEAVVVADETLAGLAVVGRMIQLTVVRREQLRLRELEPLAAVADRVGSQQYMGMIVAAARHEDGDHDAARARLAALADVLPGPAVDWCADAMAALAAELSFDLDEAGVVGPLRDRLERIRGEVVVGYSGVVCLGRADRYLGRLAAAEGDLDAAVARLAAAHQADDDDGLGLWAAWAAADEAAVRLRRRAPGDAARARALLREAAVGATTLGSPRLAAHVARTAPPTTPGH